MIANLLKSLKDVLRTVVRCTMLGKSILRHVRGLNTRLKECPSSSEQYIVFTFDRYGTIRSVRFSTTAFNLEQSIAKEDNL